MDRYAGKGTAARAHRMARRPRTSAACLAGLVHEPGVCRAAAAKKPIKDASDDDEEADEEAETPKKNAAPKRTANAKAKKAKKDESGEGEGESDEEVRADVLLPPAWSRAVRA